MKTTQMRTNWGGLFRVHYLPSHCDLHLQRPRGRQENGTLYSEKIIIIIKRTFSGFQYFLIRSHYPERRAGGTEVG